MFLLNFLCLQINIICHRETTVQIGGKETTGEIGEMALGTARGEISYLIEVIPTILEYT